MDEFLFPFPGFNLDITRLLKLFFFFFFRNSPQLKVNHYSGAAVWGGGAINHAIIITPNDNREWGEVADNDNDDGNCG